MLAMLFGASFTIITSCSNPVRSSKEGRHEGQAKGVVLFQNRHEIARYENGEVTGKITVATGQETSPITIKFIAKDSDLFQPDESGHFLDWEVHNSSIAKVEHRPEDGIWTFYIIGKSTGSTGVSLKLMHGEGEAAHAHLKTLPIPIIVNTN